VCLRIFIEKDHVARAEGLSLLDVTSFEIVLFMGFLNYGFLLIMSETGNQNNLFDTDFYRSF